MNHLRAQWRQAAQRVGRAQTISGSVVGLPADIDVTHASNFPGTGSVMLFREGRRIGYLDWSWSDRSNTVVILRADVKRPEDRRKGYGTAMVEAIYEFNPWLRGSPIDTTQSGENTPAGNAFLRSLGAKGDYHATGTCARCGQGTERGSLREWDDTGRLLHIYCHAKERAEQRMAHEAMAEAFEDRLGHCYSLAGRKVTAPSFGWVLVHGSIQGMGKPRIGHAWAITPSGEVWDGVLDETFPPDFYEDYFNAIEYGRWDVQQAAATSVREGHWGPWAGPYGRVAAFQ